MLNTLFEFMTFTFPKAGAQIGVPLTIAMFLFLLSLVKCQYKVIPAFIQIRGLSVSYLIFTACVFISMIFNLGSISSFQLTAAMVVVASPLAVGIGQSIEPQKALEVLAVSLIIVGAYALIERLAGIVSTAVPGLTYTFGQDLAQKPIGYGMAAVGAGDAQKMPTTYQNGNGAGLFYALGIPVLLAWFPYSVKRNVLKYTAIVCGLIGLFLSGSRSIMIPFVLVLIFLLILLKNKLSYQNQILFLSSLLILTALSMVYLLQVHNPFLQEAYSRYIAQTVSDPTGASRVPQFQDAFAAVNQLGWAGYVRFLLIGMPWETLGSLEGLTSVLFAYGLFGFISFVALLLSAIIGVYRHNKLASLGLICVFIAFWVDGSFNYPPSLMNFFLLTGLLIHADLWDSRVPENSFSAVRRLNFTQARRTNP